MGPVYTIKVSTHIGIHDPPDALRPASGPYLTEGLVRTATRPKALRAVGKVLRIHRFQPHGHRSLDHRVLERWLADRALSPVLLLNPDPNNRRRLVPSMAQTVVEVAQVFLQVFGVLRGRHPIDACGTCLPGLTVRLPEKVFVDQGCPGRKHPLGIAGGLLRKALKFRCDGW